LGSPRTFAAAALGDCSKDGAALATAYERSESTSSRRISLTGFRTGSVSIFVLAAIAALWPLARAAHTAFEMKSSFELFAGDKAR
jgi:hypothetical protein